jgi:RsiW-degrading membrane proteinase PrsW (M82 family)
MEALGAADLGSLDVVTLTDDGNGAATEAAVDVPRRRSRAAIVVAIAVATIAVLCGWAIYLDLNGFIGRTALVYAVVFAFVPVVPLSAMFLWLDRVRPEPTRLLVIALLWGALAATYLSLQLNGWLAGEVGDKYGATARSAVFIAPWVEETMKGAIVFAIVWWRRHDFNSELAGVVYGGLVGVGFAFTENIVYYGQLFQRVREFRGSQHVALQAVEHLFLWRGVAAPFVHPMFTMVTGLGIGMAVRYRHVGVRVIAPVAGFCAAALLHMSYNAAASCSPGTTLTAVYVAILLPAVVSLIALVLVIRRHEYRIIAARLGDFTVFGWLSPASISYVATIRGRRQARRHVRGLGPQQRDVLRSFQQVGVDLGVLRDRLVRGVAGPDELAKERELIARFRALKHRVALPGADASPAASLTRSASSW